MIHFERDKIREYWQFFLANFNIRRHIISLQTIDNIEDFVVSRSAFIAQKTLFGYVKTRMGTKYPEMFRHPEIADSLNIAKMHVFAACLSDLTIWAVANAFNGENVNDSQRQAIAEKIYRQGLESNMDENVEAFSKDEAITSFHLRADVAEWSGLALSGDIFALSPPAVVKWAPIADQLKKYDVEYVQNSVKFAWVNIRRQFLKNLDSETVSAELLTLGKDAG